MASLIQGCFFSEKPTFSKVRINIVGGRSKLRGRPLSVRSKYNCFCVTAIRTRRCPFFSSIASAWLYQQVVSIDKGKTKNIYVQFYHQPKSHIKSLKFSNDIHDRE